MTEALAEIQAVDTTTADTQTTTDTGATDKTTTTDTTATTADTQATTTEAAKTTPWGDDWRDRIADGAGKDAEDLKKLANKYGSPNGVAKALLAAQREISTRGLAKPKPEDPTDEKAMAEWRQSVGIPKDPTGYKLPDTVLKALTDEDKPVLAQFTEFAHKKGMTPDAVAGATEWYIESQRAVEEMRVQKDAKDSEDCADLLSSEWSRAEFKGNKQLAIRFLESTPLGPEGWGMMRNQKGALLANDPDFMKWASDMGREKFGDTVFASPDAEVKHTTRKKEIETIMNSDIDRYYREKLDVELLSLLEIDQKRKA